MSFETISVIGLGYIGLPTAAMFASRNVNVIGVDVDQHTVDIVNNGDIHIVEPGLQQVVKQAVEGGYLKATIKPEPADAFLIAVPTPFKGDHEPDLKYIESAAKAVARVLKKGDLVILESTSPVGATEKMTRWMAGERGDLSFPDTDGDESDIRVAHCPERVLPGQVMRELVENDRVIGGISSACSSVATSLYKTFVDGECVITNARTAEMAKLTENSFRDVNIAFANELSLICNELEIDVWELIELANRHPRVDILQPGPGVGGHCIAVDPWFIVGRTPNLANLIRTARLVNDGKPDWVVDKIKQAADLIRKPVIACFGLAFKADIDDLRESPAIEISVRIARENIGDVLLVEPHIELKPETFNEFSNTKLVDIEYAIQHADIILGLVEHSDFRSVSAERLNGKVVIDTKGMWR